MSDSSVHSSVSAAVGVILAVLGVQAGAFAQSALQLRGPDPSLEITADASGRLQPAVNTESRLRYRRLPQHQMKITVQTNLSNQSFDLSVEADDVDPSDGVAGPPVQLTEGMPATDFITDIPRFSPSRGRGGGPGSPWVEATLRYEASAALEDGRSSDRHRVIYTYVEQ